MVSWGRKHDDWSSEESVGSLLQSSLLVVFTVYFKFVFIYFIYLFIYIIHCFCNYYIFIFDNMCACMELLIEFSLYLYNDNKAFYSILFYSNEKRAEPQGKALDLPVDLRSYPHLCHEGWVMAERTRSRVQAAEMSFLRRVAGVSG